MGRFLLRAIRFVVSPRGRVAVRAVDRARRAGGEWYPVRVAGVSMIPTLRPGDLLAVRFPRPGEPRAGQVVVVTTDRIEMVKRVIATPGERSLGPDEFWLEGDNRGASTDSRSLGPVRRADIMGVVRSRYWPVVRARRFP